MAITPPPPAAASSNPADPALIAAWRRFADYDEAANKLRRSERRLRWAIITITCSVALLTLAKIGLERAVTEYRLRESLSISSSLLSDTENTGFNLPAGDLTVADIPLTGMVANIAFSYLPLLRIIVVVVALVVYGLIIYGAVYTRTNSRLEFLAYRLCANLIQHEIYLFRLYAGRYFGATQIEAQRLLKQSIDAAEKRVTTMGARPAPKLFDDSQMLKRLRQIFGFYTSDDAAFGTMTVDDYIEKRVKSLIAYYSNRQQLEAITLGRQYWLIGIVLGIGVLCIVLELEHFFLASLIIVIALNMFVEQGSYGITQLLNLPASSQLQSELDSWYVMPDAQRADPEMVSRLVQRLENIIQFEAEMWVLYSLFRSSSVNQQTVITDIMENGLSLLSNNQQISPVRYERNSIFISYRRSDSADIVGRMYDRLSAYFGKETIFRDVQTISAGEDFQRRILTAVNECNVMLAIVGTEWISVLDNETQTPRLQDPEDYVRREIAAALERPNTVVVPVLVRGARMPDEDELPEDLQQLHYRNALQVRTDPDFEEDLKRLISAIELTVRVP